MKDSKYSFYAVGGSVRDELMGRPCKDLDLLCCGPQSFAELEAEVNRLGGEIFVSKPEYFTVRCRLPEVGPCDIRLARKDGDYSDSRRPDSVSIAASVEEDLASRDLTINAIAKDLRTGKIIDPFGGQIDIRRRLLCSVGDPKTRINEDLLRVLRALRFSITLDFHLSGELHDVLGGIDNLNGVSVERIQDELTKMFRHDTLRTITTLDNFPMLRHYVFRETKIWLSPTLKSK